MNACDEFIFYEELEGEHARDRGGARRGRPGESGEVFALLLETLTALQREVAGPILASMIKDTIRRKQPSFSESAYGYRSFSALLEAARAAGLLQLSTDSRSGTYVVTEFQATVPAAAPAVHPRRSGRRRSPAAEPPSPTAAAEVPDRAAPEEVPEDEPIPANADAEQLTTAASRGPSRRRRRRRPEGGSENVEAPGGDNGVRRSRRRRRPRIRDSARDTLP